MTVFNKRLPQVPVKRSLHQRAKEEFKLWQETLPKAQRARLYPKGSTWAKHGGSLVKVALRHNGQALEQAELKRERKARLQDERIAYEERVKRPGPAASDPRREDVG